MPDLSIQLGPLKLAVPSLAASGTFGYGGEYGAVVDLSRVGAVITKSLSVKPREGNPPPRIWETPAGMLNAIGLENCGLESFIAHRLPELARLPTNVLVNVVGENIDDYATVCARLAEEGAVAGFEINISCPNVREGCRFSSAPNDCSRLIKTLRPLTKKLLMVKLSPNSADIGELARAAVEGGADALSLINTVLGMAVDIKARRPRLANITGGLSGPCIRPIAVRCVYQAAKACPGTPVVGIGGIRTVSDALEFFIAGACAVQVGTTNYFDPDFLNRFPDELEAWLADEKLASIRDLVGTLKV